MATRGRPAQKNTVKKTGSGDCLTASELKAQSKISFSGNDPSGKYQKMVRKVLKDSTTHSELKDMGEVDVIFGKIPYGNRAMFNGRYDDTDRITITLDPKQVQEDDIIHEFVHALKATDRKRKGYAATTHKRVGRSSRYNYEHYRKHKRDLNNIEEATVVAEAAIRTKRPARKPSGYYDEIPGVGRDEAKMKRAYNHDRKVLLDAPKGTPISKTKGVQGKAAVNKLNKNFTKTCISKKKVGGRSAIASYEKTKTTHKRINRL